MHEPYYYDEALGLAVIAVIAVGCAAAHLAGRLLGR
jgi:hypothetical protein